MRFCEILPCGNICMLRIAIVRCCFLRYVQSSFSVILDTIMITGLKKACVSRLSTYVLSFVYLDNSSLLSKYSNRSSVVFKRGFKLCSYLSVISMLCNSEWICKMSIVVMQMYMLGEILCDKRSDFDWVIVIWNVDQRICRCDFCKMVIFLDEYYDVT